MRQIRSFPRRRVRNKSAAATADRSFSFPISAVLAILLLFTTLGILWYRSVVKAPSRDLRFAQAAIDGHALSLEVADTPESRTKGLAGKTGLNENEGMLFIFPSADIECFWMKDVGFSIDILWFDAGKKLIHRETHVAPETYPSSFCPPSEAQYVIELPAGATEASGFVVGDILTVENL